MAVIAITTKITARKQASPLPARIAQRGMGATCRRTNVPIERSRTVSTAKPATQPSTPHNMACGNEMSHFDRSFFTKAAGLLGSSCRVTSKDVIEASCIPLPNVVVSASSPATVCTSPTASISESSEPMIASTANRVGTLMSCELRMSSRVESMISRMLSMS